MEKAMSSFEVQYLFTQYGVLVLQVVLIFVTIYFYRKLVANDNQREKRAVENIIKHWCKCVFRTVDSPGTLQLAGQKVRARFPGQMKLILAAYDELSVEEPSRYRPVMYKFLEAMSLVEADMWPSSGDALTNNLDIYS